MRAKALAALLVGALAVSPAVTACGGGTEGPDSPASTSAAAASGAPSSSLPGLATPAACDEVNRLSRQDIDTLSDPDSVHWGTFAISLQGVANASADPDFRTALTDLATAALTVSEDLAAGTPVGKATGGFLDAVPAVDHLCKLAGVPLV